MPDAARKWLEEATARETGPSYGDAYHAVAHIRRLLEQNERLDEYLEMEISLKLEAVVKLTRLEADRDALVAYVRALAVNDAEPYDGEKLTWGGVQEAWEALSPELQEAIDE